MKKHIYRSEKIQKVRVTELVPLLEGGCIVAIDVAKAKYMVALASATGETVKLARFEHPTETPDFLQLVRALQAALGEEKVRAAMEPTGTYGDAVRHQLVTSCRVSVHMISPKRTHDSQELFDGVKSLHDAKSAVLIAKLCAMGLGREWKAAEHHRVRLRALLEWRTHEHAVEEMSLSRLEGLLARHWPEFGRWLDLWQQRSSLEVLARYGCPERVAAESEMAADFLRKVSRGHFSEELREGVVSDARTTLGVPAMEEERRYIQELATQALAAQRRAEACEQQIHELGQGNAEFVALEKWMGTYTAAALITFCPPSQYATADQLEKACGLNLREKSSGEYQGQLMLTKRGPGVVRQVLYMFALRMVRSSAVVRAWYAQRESYSEKSRQRAVIAVMRKLLRAAFHVSKGTEFAAEKLFDVKKLKVEPCQQQKKPAVTKRTEPRSIGKGKKSARIRADAAA
jgi:hypothetical protein